MSEPNYTASSDELRKAYFEWRKKHPYIKASVMSFAAGWNASRSLTLSKTDPEPPKDDGRCPCGEDH